METDLAKWIATIPQPPPSPPVFSTKLLSPPSPRRQVVRPTHWPSTSFVLAGGTATFQPSTGKVLLVEDTARQQPYWFLPRGRKSVGETLEDCALRETFEEVPIPPNGWVHLLRLIISFKAGYKPELLNAPIFTRQPTLGDTGEFPSHSEAFHIQLMPLSPHRGNRRTTMYLAFWYLCTLPESAGRDSDYGKSFVGRHEKGYRSALVTVEHAVHLLSDGRFTYHPSDEIKYQGIVLDENGKEVNWDGVAGSDNGGVQALLVARGWEHVRMEEEDIGNEGTVKFTQSVLESESEGSTEAEGMGGLIVAVDAELMAAAKQMGGFD